MSPPCTASPEIWSLSNVNVTPARSISVPVIEPPVIATLPLEKLVPASVVTDTEPPVIAALFVVIVENVPAADVLAPMIVSSMLPPSKSTTDEVRFAPVIAPPEIAAFAVVIVENVPAADVVAPIAVPSIEPPVMAALAVVIVANVPFADVVAPIVVPSIAPPLMSIESVVNVENVPAALVVAPIVALSIVPASISAVVATRDEIVIEPIVPPSMESPEIWSLASVNVPADKSAVSVAPNVRPPVTTPSFAITPSIVTPLAAEASLIVSTETAPENVALAPETSLANVIPAAEVFSLIVSTEIASISWFPTARSAIAVPTLNSHLSLVSFHCRVAESSVPLSISIPAVPAVTPAAVSPLFRTIELSAISVFVVDIDVNVPLTVKSPVIIALPAIVTAVSVTVTCVEVALSSIPVDAKSEIVPPCTESPEIESLSNVKFEPVKLMSAPEIEPPVICTFADVITENVPAAEVVAPIVVSSIVPPLMSAVVAVKSENVETPVAVTPASFNNTPSTVTPLFTVFSLIVSVLISPVVIVPAPEIPAFATSIPCVVTINELKVMLPPFV